MDERDAHHPGSLAALSERDGRDLRLPASAYSETLVVPARAGRVDEVRSNLWDLGVSIDALEESTAEEAARLRAHHPTLRLPDALVLAHAEVVDADELLTTDARWKRFSRRVTVVG
jgi:predicted nucleic acid-binding protein